MEIYQAIVSLIFAVIILTFSGFAVYHSRRIQRNQEETRKSMERIERMHTAGLRMRADFYEHQIHRP